MSSGMRLLGAAVVMATLAAGNLVRATCWTQAEGFLCGPLADGPLEVRLPASEVVGPAPLDVPAPDWRPIAIALRVSGSGPLRVSERSGEPGVIVEPGRPASLLARRPSTPEDRVELWVEPVAPMAGARATVQATALAPVLASRRLLTTLAAGAAAGAVLSWALFWRRPAAAAATRRSTAAAADGSAAPVDGPAAWLAPILALAVVHGAWIVLKPPLQSPDEPQHHARATSARRMPYVAGARTLSLSASHRNPLTWPPNRLHAIARRASERLSDEDLRTLKGTRWPPRGTYPDAEAIPTAIASYPPLYYGLLFVGGELATGWLEVRPYASLLVYRAVSVLIAGALWLTLYGLMRRTPDLRRWALPAFLVLIANPATASITASVNPDAVVIPATALLLLAAWRRLAADGSDAAVLASAALALAVNPSGMLACATAGIAASWWMAQRPADRAAGVAVLRLLILVTVTAHAIFYAWSPPRLAADTTRAADSLAIFAGTVVARAPAWWAEYWGRLGWLEYSAPAAWYWALFAACVVLLGVATWRPPVTGRTLNAFLLIAGLAYAGLLLASEYAYLSTAPLLVQGRCLLPAAICLVPLVRQRSMVLAWTLPVLLLALNVASAEVAIARYFVGGWTAWLASLA